MTQERTHHLRGELFIKGSLRVNLLHRRHTFLDMSLQTIRMVFLITRCGSGSCSSHLVVRIIILCWQVELLRFQTQRRRGRMTMVEWFHVKSVTHETIINIYMYLMTTWAVKWVALSDETYKELSCAAPLSSVDGFSTLQLIVLVLQFTILPKPIVTPSWFFGAGEHVLVWSAWEPEYKPWSVNKVAMC